MLQKASAGSVKIHNQRSTHFYKNLASHRDLKPDIVIEKTRLDGKKEYLMVDTKWKNLHNQTSRVIMDDLRQMFAYHHYFDAAVCYLLYPGEDEFKEGCFVNTSFLTRPTWEKSPAE